jgi:CheY-like chemotaxis protein
MSDKTTICLLVDDEENDVLLLRREFRHTPQQMALQSVFDGTEAIRYLEGQAEYADRKTYPLPHIILVDLKMPRLDGFGFLQWLRGEASSNLRLLPVIVMSSSDLPEDLSRARALGANSYMVKPVKWQEFIERLKTLGNGLG